MGTLRIYDLDVSVEEWVPAAGVPWFVTLFGRDSLIISLQNMSVSTGFARGALKWLANYQAKERDDYRDAQPGKTLHEMRFGELAHLNKIPHTPSSGTFQRGRPLCTWSPSLKRTAGRAMSTCSNSTVKLPRSA